MIFEQHHVENELYTISKGGFLLLKSFSFLEGLLLLSLNQIQPKLHM